MIQKYILSLEASIENMKCCGSCYYWEDSSNGYICTHHHEDTYEDTRANSCDSWKLLPKSLGISTKDLNPDYVKLVNENFWNLI